MTVSRAERLQSLQEVFREVFEKDALVLTESVSKENLEAWDSLGHIRLVSQMEETLGVSFTLEEIESMSSVERILAVLEAK